MDGFIKLQDIGWQQLSPWPHFLNSGPYRTSRKAWLLRQTWTLGSVWADCILAEWFRASTQLQGHLSHSVWGAVLTWFQWLCLVSKQKLFRWEPIQLEFSMIFTWPFNTPDLQFPSFSNENLDHLRKNKLNLMLLPYICPGFPLSISLAPTISCLPPCSTHPLTRSGLRPPLHGKCLIINRQAPPTGHSQRPEVPSSGCI